MKIFIPIKGQLYQVQDSILIDTNDIDYLSKKVHLVDMNGNEHFFLPKGTLITIWIKIVGGMHSGSSKVFIKSCKENVEDLRGVNFYLNNECLSKLDLEPV